MRLKRKPTSKVALTIGLAIVTAFLVWCCYEMHRLEDLSPLSYLGPAVCAMGAVVVGTYMWRAKQSDMVDIEMKRLETIAKLKGKYGDDLSESLLKPMDYLSNE